MDANNHLNKNPAISGILLISINLRSREFIRGRF